MNVFCNKVFFRKLFLSFCFVAFLFNASFFSVRAEGEKREINKKNVLDLVNLERVNQGKNILKESDLLNQVAQSKLESLKSGGYFSHTAPDGKKAWEWFNEKGYQFSYAGENLAINFFSAEEQHKAWLNSAGHRKNILDEGFTETGIAVGEVDFKGKKAILTVQVFAHPQEINFSSPNFMPQTYSVPDNFFSAGLKNNEQSLNDDFFSGNFFGQDTESTFNFFTWLIFILITILILILEWRILIKKFK